MSDHLVIFTDPGEEIDDEIALWKLDSLASSSSLKYIIHVVVVGGTLEPLHRMQRCKAILGPPTCLKYSTPDEFDGTLMKDASVLIIGPLELSDNSERIISEEFPPKLVVLAGTVNSSVNWGKTISAQENCRKLLSLSHKSVVIESETLSLQKMTPEFLAKLPESLLPRVAALTWRFLLGRAKGPAKYVAHLASPALAASKHRPASNYVALQTVYQAVESELLADIAISDKARVLAVTYSKSCLEAFEDYCDEVGVDREVVLLEYSQVMQALLKLGWYVDDLLLSDTAALQDEVLLGGGCERFDRFQDGVFRRIGAPLPCYDHTALCNFLELL